MSIFKKKKVVKSTDIVNGQHLEDILPYMGYDKKEGILVSKNGDISKIYNLNLPKIFSVNENYYENLTQQLHDLVKRIGAGYIIQRLDFIAPQPISFDTKKLVKQDDFTGALVKHYNVQLPLNSSSFLIITKQCNTNTDAFNNKALSLKKNDFNILDADQFSDKNIENFKNVASGIGSVFKNNNIGITELTEEAINELIIKDYLGLKFTNNNSISSKDYLEKKGLLHIGDNIIKTLSVYKDGLPADIDTNTNEFDYGVLGHAFMDSIYFTGTLPKIISTSIYIQNEGEIKKLILDNKRGADLFLKDYGNKEVSDSMKDVVDNEKDLGLVMFHYGITLIGNIFAYQDFKDEVDDILQKLNTKGFYICENINQNLSHYISYLPGVTGCIPKIDRCVLPAKLAFCFPMMDSINRNITYRGIPFKERLSENLIFVDIANPKTVNFTMLFFGQPGTGKSFSVNFIIDNLIQAGHFVVVCDLGFSYKKLNEFHGGVNMECTRENPLKLNPFSVLIWRNEILQFEDDTDEDFLVSLLFTIWAGDDPTQSLEGINKQTLSLLLRRYVTECNKNKNKPNFDDYYYFSVNALDNDKEFTDISFNKADFKLGMTSFLKKDSKGEAGRYSYIFDDSVDDNYSLLKNRFVIFELEHIKNDKKLFALTYYLMSALVVRKLIREKKQRGDKKLVLVLDECWMLFSKEYGNNSAFIIYCVRTFRKHNGVLIIITQQISDIADNQEVSEVIIKSSSMKFIKQQSPGIESRNYAQNALNLTDFNTDLLYSIKNKHKELYMQFDETATVMSIDPPAYSYWLYTSNAQDNLKLQEYRDRAPNIRVAIKNLLEDINNNQKI